VYIQFVSISIIIIQYYKYFTSKKTRKILSMLFNINLYSWLWTFINNYYWY